MSNEIVLLGVAVSILFYELTGYSPAGLVVAGYIALTLQSPIRVLYTLGIVALTWLAAKGLSRVMILYGRRRFAMMILLSFVINFVVVQIQVLPHNPGIIGCLVPGIIAQEWERNGVLISTLSLGVVVGILTVILMLLGIPVVPYSGGF